MQPQHTVTAKAVAIVVLAVNFLYQVVEALGSYCFQLLGLQ
jgi:hypothetical protein